MRRHTLLLLALAILAAVPLALARPRILDPRYSVPLPLLPGQLLNVTLIDVENATIGGVWITAPGVNYTLKLLNVTAQGDTVVLTLRVPEEVRAGLYDVYVRVGDEVLGEPRSVWLLSAWPSRLLIMHITDVHIDIVTEGVHSTTYFETAMGLLNTLPADLAVITGDCVDVGSDLGALKVFSQVTNRARKPTFIIPGNHDHSQTDSESFSKLYYGRYVGPAYWYRVIGPFLIAGLDLGMEGYPDSQQLKWLEGVLSRHRDKVKIILMHHPFFRYGVFGEINGSWKSIEDLSNVIYSSWAEHMDAAQEFLRIVEENGVRLVLSGHVHGDGVVLYNGVTWFVTTTTTCAGVREGDYRGFRLIEVREDGSVKIYGIPGRDPLKEFSSFNIEEALIRTIPDPELRANTALVRLGRGLGIEPQRIHVYMYLNGTVPADRYALYGNLSLVEGYSLTPYGDLYLANVTLRVQPGVEIQVTASCYKDEWGPEVRLLFYTPRKPVAGRDSVTLYVKAVDEGWGIKEVKVSYTANATRGEVNALRVSPTTYRAVLPPINATALHITVKAVDLAGNTSVEEGEISYVQPAKPQEEQAPSEQAPPPSKPEEARPPVPTSLILAIAVVALVVAALVVVLTRRRK